MKAARTLQVGDYPVFEQLDLDIFSMDVGSSQFHMMLRQMQRDHGTISDKEMALAERIIGVRKPQESQRVKFNPFTGIYRK
jgi:hypothetical protein